MLPITTVYHKQGSKLLTAIEAILVVRNLFGHASVLPSPGEVHGALEGIGLLLAQQPAECGACSAVVVGLGNIAQSTNGDTVVLGALLFRRFLMLQALDMFEAEVNALLTDKLGADRYAFAADTAFMTVCNRAPPPPFVHRFQVHFGMYLHCHSSRAPVQRADY